MSARFGESAETLPPASESESLPSAARSSGLAVRARDVPESRASNVTESGYSSCGVGSESRATSAYSAGTRSHSLLGILVELGVPEFSQYSTCN